MPATSNRVGSLLISMAMSPHPSVFAPLVFAGRLDEGITRLSEAGFNGVEISIRHATDINVVWLKKKLAETRMELSAFATGRLYLEESICLSNARADNRKQILKELSAIIDLAAHFHAPVIIGGVRGKFTGGANQWIKQRSSAVDILRKCASVAGSLGTFLLLEPLNRYETNFINSAQEGLDFIDEIGNPAIKLLLDTFHMNIEEANPCDSIRKAGRRLGYVHIADNNRLSPGHGHIDFQGIVQTLTDISYNGFISAEILPFPDDASALADTGKFLHALVSRNEFLKV